MSGVDAQYLAGKTFGLYLVALGLLQWLDPVLEKPSSPGWDRRVSDWQLRYGYGGTDLRRIPEPAPGWHVFFWIAFGACYLLIPGFAGRMEPIMMIVMGGFFLGVTLLGVLTEPWFEARRIRRYEARLEAIAQNAGQQSEEMRAALANPPRIVSRRRQLVGSLLFAAFGAAFLTLGLIAARQ